MEQRPAPPEGGKAGVERPTAVRPGLALAVGIGVGTAIGVASGRLMVWLPLGIAVGVMIGRIPPRRTG